MTKTAKRKRPRVVIVGGGFAGLNAAKSLRKAPVDVVLVDRRNHHLFQPLLYQVATALLSPADIATPIRKVLNRQRNAEVILAEVESVNIERQCLVFESSDFEFDYLILATGATHSYFGHSEWAQTAPGLKTIEDATEIRRRFLIAFETAELEADPEARRAELTFIVVGAGPTGIELAGAMAEIARTVIPRDFRAIDTTTARVVLVEGQTRILPGYPEKSSTDAQRQLEQLGVEILTETFVTEVDEQGVRIGEERIDAGNVLWAAGVEASPLGATLGVETDRAGHVIVEPDLSIKGHPDVFVVGDLAHALDAVTGNRVPGVAQGAIQMGNYVARVIEKEVTSILNGEGHPKRDPFTYKDKGTMATIGRNKAVAVVKGTAFKGRIAWFMWAVIHILFLISFRNRLTVMFSWVWTYLFFDRGARLITGDSHIHVKVPRDLDQ